MALKQRSFEIE